MKALEIFQGSDAEVTKAYYAQLATRGAAGELAVNLLRAQKASSRAKVYHASRIVASGINGRWRSLASFHAISKREHKRFEYC